jgi:probable addiction module antidote protein
MFVRFRKPKMRLQVSLVASHRICGKITHEHVASLGSISDPASPHDRLEFWKSLHEHLGRLGKRIGVADVGKLVAAVHKRIPMVEPEEQRELTLKKDQETICIERSPHHKKANLDHESPLIKSLNDAFETAQEKNVSRVLAAIIKASNKTSFAIEGGSNRTTLYRAFQAGHHPKLLTVLNVLNALDLRLECYSHQSGMVDEKLHLGLAQLNEGFKTANIKSVYAAFGALIGVQSNFTALAEQLAMSRTSLYRWLRSGRSPTLLSIMDLAIALQLGLKTQRNMSS